MEFPLATHPYKDNPAFVPPQNSEYTEPQIYFYLAYTLYIYISKVTCVDIHRFVSPTRWWSLSRNKSCIIDPHVLSTWSMTINLSRICEWILLLENTLLYWSFRGIHFSIQITSADIWVNTDQLILPHLLSSVTRSTIGWHMGSLK